MSKIVANQLSPQSGDTITINGGISVGGTVTYEDVTNVDSVGIITARSDVSIADKIVHTGDTNTSIRFPAADTFTVETAGSEALRVDSSGRLLVGTDTSQSVGFVHNVQVEGTDASSSSFSLLRNSDNAFAPQINFGKTRGTSTGSNTVVQDDDSLGQLNFRGGDGTDKATSAVRIEASVDGTPGSNDMPGRLTFHTTADGNAGVTERLRIDSEGRLLVNNTAPFGTQDRSSFHSFLQVKGNSFSNNGDGAISLGTGSASGTDSVTGSIFFNDVDGGDRAAVRGFSESAGGSGNYPGYLTFYTNEGTANPSERVRITASGAAIFKSGLAEKYENAGTTLGAQTNNPLKDGNVILFTGNESGNKTINFTGVHSTISNGETVSFTVIITPNNSGVINTVQIDGQAITVKWSGGSAPSAGSSGQDIYTFQILKTGTGTSDYTIFGAAANYA